MGETATITIDGVSHELPIVTGTEGERAIDISSLRASTGLITGSCGTAASRSRTWRGAQASSRPQSC